MLAKIGGVTSSAFCHAASSRAVVSMAKTPMSTSDVVRLGERKEIVGSEQAEARMTPARQRFEAGDGAVLEPHDGLKQHGDLAAIERMAQIVGERKAVRALGAHAPR